MGKKRGFLLVCGSKLLAFLFLRMAIARSRDRLALSGLFLPLLWGGFCSGPPIFQWLIIGTQPYLACKDMEADRGKPCCCHLELPFRSQRYSFAGLHPTHGTSNLVSLRAPPLLWVSHDGFVSCVLTEIVLSSIFSSNHEHPTSRMRSRCGSTAHARE